MSRHLVVLTFDFDTVALWLATGHTSPTAISRGEFGVLGAERIVRLLATMQVPSTWFVPGITAGTFPHACRMLVEAGAEIGHHGYDHISPAGLSREQEADQLVRGIDAIVAVSGEGPRGYRSPAWELSGASIELLLYHGFEYDSSMMAHDCLPYFARTGDAVTPGEPVRFGRETRLVELPVSWTLDDFPHLEYFRGGGLRPASAVLEAWIADFDYLCETVDWGVLTYTFHPFVIGRGHRMKVLERLIEALRDRGAVFVTAGDAVAEFLERQP